MIQEEDDVDMHHPSKGLPMPFPVLLEEDDNITLEDIERMVRRAPGLDDQSKILDRLGKSWRSWMRSSRNSRGEGTLKHI